MSILICEILPKGIVFAADRYSTVSRQQSRGDATTVVQGQDEASKIVRWPHRRALAGAVGLGTIGRKRMNEWLFDIVGDHAQFDSSEVVAEDIRDRLQAELTWDDQAPERVIVEFATYGKRDGHTVPEFWHITNIPGIDPETGYLPATDSFTAEEQILGKHLREVLPADLKDYLGERASQHDPYWFHQGIELVVFNSLSSSVKAAFRGLQEAGRLSAPTSLRDWERHARMWVLIYGAFYEAFGEPGERYVGGGADVLSIPWPDR